MGYKESLALIMYWIILMSAAVLFGKKFWSVFGDSFMHLKSASVPEYLHVSGYPESYPLIALVTPRNKFEK
jgi:hypothetical protein